MTAAFDPAHTVQFDLGRGQVRVDRNLTRLVLPADAVSELCQNAGEAAVQSFGRGVGTEVGRRVADRLGGLVSQVSVEDMIEHLGGELAIMGLGSLGGERWGRALVLTIEHSPFGHVGDRLLAAVLEGALQRVMARQVHAIVLERDDARLRVLIAGSEGAARAREWLSQGIPWGQVLARLHGAFEHGAVDHGAVE